MCREHNEWIIFALRRIFSGIKGLFISNSTHLQDGGPGIELAKGYASNIKEKNLVNRK
jgi:hypothetical protein